MQLIGLHRLPRAIALASLLALPALAAAAPGPDDIVLLEPRGAVALTMRGVAHEARDGSVLELPATLVTGRDGSARLRQGDTAIGVGPGTRLDFPAAVARRAGIERVVQPSGNAFYDVGPLGGRRLRVETPYLVAVIKGTQFNVAVDPDASTISLFEGSLEVIAEDIGASVLLNAGEIAIRRRGEDTIRVISAIERAAAAGSRGSGTDEGSPGGGDADAAAGGAAGPAAPAGPLDDLTGTGSSDTPIDPVEGKVSVGGDVALLPGVQLGAEADVTIGAGGAGADVGVDAAIGGIAASAGAELQLGGSGVEAGADLGADLGGTGVDASLDASLDPAAGSVGAAVEAGVLGADVTADVGADLGIGGADLDADLGADLGGTGVDASLDAGVDPAAGTVDAGVDAGLLGTDAALDVGADLVGEDAGLDVGLDLLGTEIDLGLGGGDPAPEPGTESGSESGGVLGGLLGRPRL